MESSQLLNPLTGFCGSLILLICLGGFLAYFVTHHRIVVEKSHITDRI